jgi:hypothetical protein
MPHDRNALSLARRIFDALSVMLPFALTSPLAFAAAPVVSEDFESGRIDPAKWEIRTKEPNTKIEMKVVEGGAHGRYALQVHYPAGTERSGFAYLMARSLPASVRGHLFGRAYVKIPAGLPLAHTQLLFAGAAGYPVAKYQEIGINLPARRATPDAPLPDPATVQPRWVFIYQQNEAKTPAEGRGEDVRQTEAQPYGKWILLEWEFNDHPTSTRIWIDGKPVAVKEGDAMVETFSFHWPKNSPDANGLVGGYAEAGFGARSFSPGVTKDFDVFFDDIAISTERIGPAK